MKRSCTLPSRLCLLRCYASCHVVTRSTPLSVCLIFNRLLFHCLHSILADVLVIFRMTFLYTTPLRALCMPMLQYILLVECWHVFCIAPNTSGTMKEHMPRSRACVTMTPQPQCASPMFSTDNTPPPEVKSPFLMNFSHTCWSFCLRAQTTPLLLFGKCASYIEQQTRPRRSLCSS